MPTVLWLFVNPPSFVPDFIMAPLASQKRPADGSLSGDPDDSTKDAPSTGADTRKGDASSREAAVLAQVRALIDRERTARRRARQAVLAAASAPEPSRGRVNSHGKARGHKTSSTNEPQAVRDASLGSGLKFWFNTPGDIVARRTHLGLSQAEFWGSILVGQGRGCRYEQGHQIPTAIKMLLQIAYGSEKQGDGLIDTLRQGKLRGKPARQRVRRKRATATPADPCS